MNNPATFLSTLNVSGFTTLANTSTFRGATTCLSSLNVSGTTVLANTTTCLSTLNCNGVLYIYGNPASNPGSNGYACLWNQSGVGPTLSGYQISLTTGTTPTTERMRIDNKN